MSVLEHEARRRALQWLEYADEDLGFARHGLNMGPTPPHRLIAYHAPQSVEKSLKAYLVFRHVDFPFTHNIGHLLELCTDHPAWVDTLRDAEELTAYAVTARYPGEDLIVSETEARRAIEIAAHLRDVVRTALTEEGLSVPGS